MKNKNILLILLGSIAAVGASLYFIKRRKAIEDEKPPKGAPQLHIENPGTQANFPSSATESEIG